MCLIALHRSHSRIRVAATDVDNLLYRCDSSGDGSVEYKEFTELLADPDTSACEDVCVSSEQSFVTCCR
jgi:hypothetical protein